MAQNTKETAKKTTAKNTEIAEKLRNLARKYETADFLDSDPSQFMHRFSTPVEQEIVAFIAASLSFGQRKQTLSHMEMILADIRNKSLNPTSWITTGAYKRFFTLGEKAFHRMFTHNSLKLTCDTLGELLCKHTSLGQAFKELYLVQQNSGIHLCQIIARAFPANCNIIPHTPTSAFKRINMFLRWMVRTDSPVDLGLWTWFPKTQLLMPLDTHVMRQATDLGFLAPGANGKLKNPSLKIAVELTQKVCEIFPRDPLKADFALFGHGVTQDSF